MVLGNRFGVRGLVFVVGAMVGACATPSDEGGQGGYVGGNASAEPSADGFLTFNHEADWEHVRVTIAPKANGAEGKALEVKLSAHKGGTILKVGDPKLEMDGTHPISYVAKGTHANYSKPGTYQVFVKYWGRWGQIGTNSETSGITRHFP